MSLGTDPLIVCHNSDPAARAMYLTWLPVSGSHEYRGTGRAVDGDLIWEPCRVCGVSRDDPPHGRPYRSCGFCGSIHPYDLEALIAQHGWVSWQDVPQYPDVRDPGDHRFTYEWADFKYGYPHKLYIHGHDGFHAKFYIRHLMDLDDEAFARLAPLVSVDSISFQRDEEGRLMWELRRA